MTSADSKQFVAADVYPSWRRRVKAAEQSVRVYTPYLDRLVVSLLGNTDLGVKDLSIVTDLSPASGTLNYRGQLLALKRVLEQGVEVRSLARLHAKVLLVDGQSVTVGSQNFTSYGRGSRETTTVTALDLGESKFILTLEDWYDEAEPVDLELVKRLLEILDEQMADAKSAIEVLVAAYEEEESDYREEQRRVAVRRFEQDVARARASSTSAGIGRADAASPYSAGQSVAYARLAWLDEGYQTLKRFNGDVDLTSWRASIGNGRLATVNLGRLAFYPVLLGPGGRLAFVRVGKSRITYVWRGVRWGAARSIGGYRVYEHASFPDNQPDGANLVLTFAWTEGTSTGFRLRMRFDGNSVLPVADGELVGGPWEGSELTQVVESAYEDEEAWNDVLKDVFSPAYNPRGFRDDRNAASFFPPGWLRIDHTKFLGESILLVQPH